MFLGRVIGNLVATQKEPQYEGKALLLVQPVAPEGNVDGKAIGAVDSVGSGAGETVLVVIEGRSSSIAMGQKLAPANAAIVGIVDHIDWES